MFYFDIHNFEFSDEIANKVVVEGSIPVMLSNKFILRLTLPLEIKGWWMYKSPSSATLVSFPSHDFSLYTYVFSNQGKYACINI